MVAPGLKPEDRGQGESGSSLQWSGGMQVFSLLVLSSAAWIDLGSTEKRVAEESGRAQVDLVVFEGRHAPTPHHTDVPYD